MKQEQNLVWINSNLHHRARVIALELNLTIKEIVGQAVEQYLLPIEDALAAEGKVRIVVRDRETTETKLDAAPAPAPTPAYNRMVEIGERHREKMLRMLVAQGTELDAESAAWLTGRAHNTPGADAVK